LAVSVTVGGATPVPVKLTTVGLVDALDATLRVALSNPVAPGLKVTDIVQVALVASAEAQPLVSANEDGFAPLMVAALMDSDPVPVLVTVIT